METVSFTQMKDSYCFGCVKGILITNQTFKPIKTLAIKEEISVFLKLQNESMLLCGQTNGWFELFDFNTMKKLLAKQISDFSHIHDLKTTA